MLGTVISVISGKGGTGKTTVSAGIAVALCALGEKVLIIDGDIGLRCMDIVLGMTGDVLFSYGDVILGNATLKQAAVRHDVVKNLYLLTAPTETGDENITNAKNIAAFLRYARRHFTYIIIDCGAGLSESNFAFSFGSDRAIVVSTADETALRGAQKIANRLYEGGMDDIKIVVNKVRAGDIKKGASPDIDKVMDATGLGLLGIVPEDFDLVMCANTGKVAMLYSDGKGVGAFNNIARRIKGEKVKLLKI